MVRIGVGQCGMCAHFGGAGSGEASRLVQIRVSGQAPEDMVEACARPGAEGLGLRVTPISGCDGFTPADGA